ncbi:MAG: hypothetical protein K0S54_3201 [Alphaproteobacteria bacterium]|jgi:hypothetical protein|nr:hypothetical protein [Alphaproteobacteria bacterium]
MGPGKTGAPSAPLPPSCASPAHIQYEFHRVCLQGVDAMFHALPASRHAALWWNPLPA